MTSLAVFILIALAYNVCGADDAPDASPAKKDWTGGPHVKKDTLALRRRIDALYTNPRYRRGPELA